MTDLIRALTAGVSESAVPWKYQRTIPPFVKIVNKSNIFLHYYTKPLNRAICCTELTSSHRCLIYSTSLRNGSSHVTFRRGIGTSRCTLHSFTKEEVVTQKQNRCQGEGLQYGVPTSFFPSAYGWETCISCGLHVWWGLSWMLMLSWC